ncbi:MAG: hypothetical protein LH469_11835 [Frankiaceae bacterium]|nr:hypothetical protein [Frankiaceae bacterium]
MIGSQSILATYDEEELPVAATASVEVDLAFFDDDDDARADQVDGAIGELPQFHETFGFYAQGVSVKTAVLPNGWRNRVVVELLDRIGRSGVPRPPRLRRLQAHRLPRQGPRFCRSSSPRRARQRCDAARTDRRAARRRRRASGPGHPRLAGRERPGYAAARRARRCS